MKIIKLSLMVGGILSCFICEFIIIYNLFFFREITIIEPNLFVIIFGDFLLTFISFLLFISFMIRYIRKEIKEELNINDNI